MSGGIVESTACARCGHPEWIHAQPPYGCAECLPFSKDAAIFCGRYIAHNACETRECDGSICFVVYWPGQTRRFCAPCTVRAQRVAAFMGFVVDCQVIA